MKTLSVKSASSKLEKLTIKSETNNSPISKTSIAYKFAKEIIEGAKQIRPCYTSGKGRFCSNQDHTESLKAILNKIGIEYVFTNDSQRGGLTGNLITITTKIK
jgi:hypothetical protein